MPPTYPAPGTPVERAGGLTYLRAIAARIGRRPFVLVLDESEASFSIVAVVYPTGTPVDDPLRVWPEPVDVIVIETCFVARSAAVREDQRTRLREDRDELGPILRRLVELVSVAPPTETELRAMDGDR